MLKDIIQETCNNTVLWMLVAVITFDYITGVIKGALWRVNDSQVGMKGLIKHGLVLAGFLVAYPFASIMDATGVVLWSYDRRTVNLKFKLMKDNLSRPIPSRTSVPIHGRLKDKFSNIQESVLMEIMEFVKCRIVKNVGGINFSPSLFVSLNKIKT